MDKSVQNSGMNPSAASMKRLERGRALKKEKVFTRCDTALQPIFWKLDTISGKYRF